MPLGLSGNMGQRGGLTRAVAFYNPTDQPQTVQIALSDLELGGKVLAKDLFDSDSQLSILNSQLSIKDIPPHGCRIFRMTGEKPPFMCQPTTRLPRVSSRLRPSMAR